jgi:hypothetical protein
MLQIVDIDPFPLLEQNSEDFNKLYHQVLKETWVLDEFELTLLKLKDQC